MATATAESIFDIFKKHKVPVNGALFPRHISASIHLWEKSRQDNFPNEMKSLVTDGFVIADGDAYKLTQKGYNRIYEHYSLQDTVDLILSVFHKKRIDKNDILLLPSLLSALEDADRYHFDNYDTAIKLLAQKGWITANGRGFILSNEGYNEVYPS